MSIDRHDGDSPEETDELIDEDADSCFRRLLDLPDGTDLTEHYRAGLDSYVSELLDYVRGNAEYKLRPGAQSDSLWRRIRQSVDGFERGSILSTVDPSLKAERQELLRMLRIGVFSPNQIRDYLEHVKFTIYPYARVYDQSFRDQANELEFADQLAPMNEELGDPFWDRYDEEERCLMDRLDAYDTRPEMLATHPLGVWLTEKMFLYMACLDAMLTSLSGAGLEPVQAAVGPYAKLSHLMDGASLDHHYETALDIYVQDMLRYAFGDAQARLLNGVPDDSFDGMFESATALYECSAFFSSAVPQLQEMRAQLLAELDAGKISMERIRRFLTYVKFALYPQARRYDQAFRDRVQELAGHGQISPMNLELGDPFWDEYGEAERAFFLTIGSYETSIEKWETHPLALWSMEKMVLYIVCVQAMKQSLRRERSLFGYPEDFARRVAPEYFPNPPDPFSEPERSAVFRARLDEGARHEPKVERTARVVAESDCDTSTINRRYGMMPESVIVTRALGAEDHDSRFPREWTPGSTLVPGMEVNMPYVSAKQLVPPTPELSRKNMTNTQLHASLYLPFHGLFLDSDGVLFDGHDDAESPVALRIHHLASIGVPIAICTGGDVATVTKKLQRAAAFPGVLIYGENGVQRVQSVAGEWREFNSLNLEFTRAEFEEYHRVAERFFTLTKRVTELMKSSPLVRANVEKLKIKVDRYSMTLVTPFRHTGVVNDVPRMTTLSEIANLLLGPDGKSLEYGYRIGISGSSIQIYPRLLSKWRCLTNFRQSAENVFSKNTPLRIMRIADQGTAWGRKGTPLGATFGCRLGVDVDIIDHPEGFSTLYDTEHGNSPPIDDETGHVLERSEATNWLLDRARFQLLNHEGKPRLG